MNLALERLMHTRDSQGVSEWAIRKPPPPRNKQRHFTADMPTARVCLEVCLGMASIVKFFPTTSDLRTCEQLVLRQGCR